MDSLQINRNVCRICLGHKIILNWDQELFAFGGISYKDCYYKYTQLDKRGSDHFPTNLCEMCADELKNAHFLFEKALESFNILRGALSTKKLEIKNTTIEVWNSPSQMEFESNNYSDIKPNAIHVEFSHVSENDTDTENVINNSEEMSICENIKIENSHFIDIQNFESSEVPLQEFQSCILQLPEPPLINISKDNTKLTESLDSKNFENKIEKCETASQSLLEQNNTENCATEVTSTTNDVLKTTKEYLCQYCSLKVNGITQLKRHEATHSDNRKRTETCPHCGLKLYTKLSLSQHIKIHDQNRERKNKCEFCDKAFFNKGGLNVHRRIHLGQMMICRICSKEFYRQIDLDRHLLKHSVCPKEKNVGKTKYTVQCQYCNKYVLTLKWKEHKAAHLNQPQVKCKLCDKNFFSRTKCVSHLHRLHRKGKSEYENFIHYFVDNKGARISHLKLKQEGNVQPLLE